MTKPAWKTPAMNEFLENLFTYPRLVSIEGNTCSNCGESGVEFTDELSRREFSISGMCQKCQDNFFNHDPEDEV